MATKLMHDGGSVLSSGTGPLSNTAYAKKKMFGNQPKPKPKPKYNSAEYGSATGGKYNPKNTTKKVYTQTKSSHARPKVGVAKPKASSKSGGAYGAGGKFYKNGYVDSKGNRVVNGKWAAPVAKKTSGSSNKTGSSISKSPSKVVSAPKSPTVKAPSAPKPKPLSAAELAKQKADSEKKYLAGDTQYQNELGGLTDALSRYLEQNTSDRNTLKRGYNSQVGSGGSIEKNRKKSQVGNSEGFASRGMLRSGGYSDSASDINDTYKEQTSRVTDAYNDDNNRLTRASGAEKETVNQKKEQARIAALSRKANQEILKAQTSSQ